MGCAGWGPGPVTQVSVFDPGATARNPGRTLTGLNDPIDVEVHPVTGEVFVANRDGDNVLVYDPGATVPNPAKTRTGVVAPSGLAFYPNGNLLVSSGGDARIYGYLAGALTPVGSFASTVVSPMGIALHPVTGDLYVPDGLGTVVKVFERGSSTPNAAKTLTGVDHPRGIDFHPANGSAYVSSYNGGAGKVFPRGAVVAADTLTSLTGPWGVAVNPRTGQVLVAEANGVEVFAAPAPTVTSVDPATGPITGGSAVTIHGTNLGTVSAVRFGSVPATIVGTPGYTSLQVTTPATTTAGPVTVEVTSAGTTAGKVGAFTYTAVPPAPATGVTGAWGDRQVTVSWTAPASSGGVPIQSYTVTSNPPSTPCVTTATSCIIGGLTNGTPYLFRVVSRNTAGMVSLSEPSAAVTPAVAVSLKVKAKKASYRPVRKGTRTIVNYAKKPSNATRVVTRACSNPTGLRSKKLCTFTVTKKGKVKVRTKGYRNVVITVSIQNVPKASAGPTFGPSRVWTRSWRVK